jgi:TolA-binding protein
VYPDPRVRAFISELFVPVRVHVKQQADEYKRLGARFNAQWTPTTLIVDGEGQERHRIEGFLPADDFVPQLRLGLGHSAFARGQFAEAAQRFDEVVTSAPASDAAPEALYWAGVARYKATSDPSSLRETAQAFQKRYQDSTWAKKASVWAA